MGNAYAVRSDVGRAMTVTGDPPARQITINYADNKMALTNVQIDVGTDTATGTVLDKTTGKTYQRGSTRGGVSVLINWLLLQPDSTQPRVLLS